MVSGGFDPLHVGHLRMIQSAAAFGRVHIALNSDRWLMRKKGFVFMPLEERRAILSALRAVAFVIRVWDDDDTVAHAISTWRPAYFVNGGDRTEPNPVEHAACLDVGCQELWNIGGGKIQSSSELARKVPR